MKVEYYRDRHGKWRWLLVARNGRILAAPPANLGYARKANAKRALWRVAWLLYSRQDLRGLAMLYALRERSESRPDLQEQTR